MNYYCLMCFIVVVIGWPRMLWAQPVQVFVDSAVRAMGGSEALLTLKSQRIVSHGENFEPEQAARPGGEPRKVSTFTCTLLRDLNTGKVRYEWIRETPPPFSLKWQYTEILDADTGAIIGADGGRSPAKRPASATRIAARRKELSRSAVTLLINALSRSNSFLRLMDQVIGGRQQYVISYNDHGQLVILAIDAETRLPTKVEFLEDDPLYGDVQNELRFSDWRQVGKLQLPFSLRYRVNGREVATEQIDSIENDVELKSEDFAIPEELSTIDSNSGKRGERSSHWVLRRVALASPLDDEQTRVELTEVTKGVLHITGGTHHSMVVEMKDHLVVVEAPLYEERSRAVLDELAKKFPGKPVKALVMTHFHNDHSGGVRTYIAAGAVIVAGKVNEEFLKKVASASHTRVPDSLQENPKPAVIETVNGKPQVFADGERTVEIHPVKSTHAEGIVVAYLPKEKLLFVSDLYSPGAPRQVALFCRELLEAIQQHGLQVERIVGGHGKVSPLQELQQVAAASP